MSTSAARPLQYVLLGDGDSPHLLKWARALSQQDGLQLWAASSRGFLPGFDDCVPATRRLALHTRPRFEGGNVALLRHLPLLTRWLKTTAADWVHAHYLTSHGTLAWLAQRWGHAPGRLVGSAWGSDVLVAPQRSVVLRHLTRQVLRACVLSTSDSQVMARRMRDLGAREVMVFPFGLEAMPDAPQHKDPRLFFANRGLEPIYAPQRVLAQFAAVAGAHDRLVLAHTGSLLASLQQQAAALGLMGASGRASGGASGPQVQFVGHLDAATQAAHYAAARWYLSLPQSDSVSVSVLEAMAHGCLPLLSDIPANRELVRDGDNGLIVPAGALLSRATLQALAERAESVAQRNRHWVEQHALFAPCVAAFVQRLRALS